MPDPYRVLGVQKAATDKEIKQAYRELAAQWHPDRNKAPEATAKFQEISAAYNTLSDPEARRRFDLTGDLPTLDPDAARNVFRNVFVAGDFLGQMFNEFRGPPIRPQVFEATLEELAARATKKFRIERTRHDRGGEKETVFCEIRLNSGMRTGASAIARGKGDVMANGAVGALRFVLRVKPHPVFTPEGDNLRAVVPVTLKDALLGVKVVLQGVKGETIPITVPGVVDPDVPYVVPHAGMPRAGAVDNRGALVVFWKIVMPKRLTAAQEEALRDLL